MRHSWVSSGMLTKHLSQLAMLIDEYAHMSSIHDSICPFVFQEDNDDLYLEPTAGRLNPTF